MLLANSCSKWIICVEVKAVLRRDEELDDEAAEGEVADEGELLDVVSGAVIELVEDAADTFDVGFKSTGDGLRDANVDCCFSGLQ